MTIIAGNLWNLGGVKDMAWDESVHPSVRLFAFRCCLHSHDRRTKD